MKTKSRCTTWPIYRTPCHIPQKSISYYRNTCSAVPISTLIIRGRKWKQPKCFSANEWIMKYLCMYAMEFYSDINKLNDKSCLERRNWKILYYTRSLRSQKINTCSLLFVDVCLKSLDFSTWLGVATEVRKVWWDYSVSGE